MSDFSEDLGRRVRAARHALGLSQGDVSKALGNRTQTTVSYWESGRTVPSLPDLQRLATLFVVPVRQLIPGGDALDPATLAEYAYEAHQEAQKSRQRQQWAWEQHDYMQAVYQRGMADAWEQAALMLTGEDKG